MAVFRIHNPATQHAELYINGRLLHVPARDYTTLEAGLATAIARDLYTFDALKTILDGRGRQLGLSYVIDDA